MRHDSQAPDDDRNRRYQFDAGRQEQTARPDRMHWVGSRMERGQPVRESIEPPSGACLPLACSAVSFTRTRLSAPRFHRFLNPR